MDYACELRLSESKRSASEVMQSRATGTLGQMGCNLPLQVANDNSFMYDVFPHKILILRRVVTRSRRWHGERLSE